jgi:hypothetical protein
MSGRVEDAAAAAIANGSASDAVAFLEDTLSKVISIAKSG